ncbi:GLUG motif-containing protein [Halopiger goleimassiliensis]|uniref:GLUG motif-containing protein n=1 Tax=Halopiger goleimassiliensis TaxID=1293048 RepID=UPI000677CA60|nr:GLUG motif-containing protein [Halopiger goleimassiliensis]
MTGDDVDLTEPSDPNEVLEHLDGDGTPADPYVITSVRDLTAIDHDLDAHYVLGCDIDASATGEWNDGAGFDPIGDFEPDNERRFCGTFDGDSHEIIGLTIDRPESYPAGLFAVVGDGEVHNVDIVDATVSCKGYGGVIAGINQGTIANVTACGDVRGDRIVGTVLGSNAGTVRGVSAEGTVEAPSNAGGIVGKNRGNGVLEAADADVDVTSSADDQLDFTTDANLGGVVGINAGGVVTSATASGSITGGKRTGSIAGTNEGTIEEAKALGPVEGNSLVGGIVGTNAATRASIVDSTASSALTGNAMSVGGVAGSNDGRIADCSATVEADPESMYAGGFVGQNSGDIARCNADGTIEGVVNRAGGFAGTNDGEISTSTVSVDVRGEGRSGGGFVAENDGTIDRCRASGELLGNWNKAGGIAGTNDGTIERSRATGDVIGDRFVGGISGTNHGTVARSLAATSLYGQGTVGGCIGRLGRPSTGSPNRAVVETSYWDRDVAGTDDAVGTRGDGELVVESVDGFDSNALSGSTAEETLTAFAFDEAWVTVPDEYPEPRVPESRCDDEPSTPAPDPERYADLLAAADGTGTEDDPYVITDVRELQAIDADVEAHYVLGCDIDARTTAGWNDGDGFAPIGSRDDEDQPFSGELDGSGHRITGLEIDRQRVRVGLFAEISDGHVRDLILDDVSISGFTGVGGLCGASDGSIVDVTITGTVAGQNTVGLLTGTNNESGSVRGGSVDGAVSANESVGGLVGISTGSIAETTVQVTIDAQRKAGGIVGLNAGTIERIAASADLEEATLVGGIAGVNGERIERSIAFVQTGSTTNCGGVVGQNEGTVTEVAAAGSIAGMSTVGGVAGTNVGSIADAVSRCDVSGQQSVGGVVGKHAGSVTAAVALGETGSSMTIFESIGGIVGSIPSGDHDDATLKCAYYDAVSAECSGAIGTEHGESTVECVEGLGTKAIRGTRAVDRLNGVDFEETWIEPTAPDEPPRLASLDGLRDRVV